MRQDLVEEHSQSLLRKENGIIYDLYGCEVDGRKTIYCHFDNKDADFFKIASTGTRSLALFYYWYIRMEKASFVFIDEFDAFYHYELSEAVQKRLRGMYVPLIAHLCTRVITKERFELSGDESLLLKMSRKKMIWFFVAMLLPFIYCEIGHAILVLVYPKLLLSKTMCMTFGITTGGIWGNIGRKLFMSLAFALVAIGEESGFRGYMMPKLMILFGTGKAVIVGGIVWGLWHLPLICMGHNFGTSYPGFPFLGIILMTVECICAGSILTFLTIKSKSIWPAAVMHAVNNSNPGVLALLLNTYELGKMNTIVVATITLIPLFILGIICLLIMIKQNTSLFLDSKVDT